MTSEQTPPVQTKHEPSPGDRREEIWLEERYWGHRLLDQQSPWLVFLEFFSVAESAHHSGHLFDFDKSLYPAWYRPYGRIHLRNILFNNEQQLQAVDEATPDSNAAWRTWLEWIGNHCHGLDPDQRDFSYLKERFNSFHDFAQLVRALRSCTVEGHTNKRWSSRFLFPFGPAATYEDLKIVAEKPERDRINFGRTGELLYLMLSRSKSRATLAQVFPPRVLDESNKWNHLVRRIQPVESPDDRRESKGKHSYLPYDKHPTFDIIADDWIALLDLRLPGFDVVPHLVTSGAFGILLYHLQTSAYLLNRDRKPDLICEIVAPRKGLVREQSVESFEANSALSVEAIDKVITNVETFDRWMESGPAHEMLSRRREILKEEFSWEDEATVADPEDLLRRFREEAKRRHRQHFAHVHRSYGRGIGLVSRRGTNRFRYAPNDDFLKYLVFANVRKRTEFGEFLANLHARYGLVFGEHEAATALDATDIDKKPFQANAQRLEHRLGSLGLLRRLSDACAFVENPYARA